MSLASLLTPTRLRALAGYSFERGDRYWQQGRVRSCVEQGERIVGTVQGTHEYAVELFAHGRNVVAQCTCPVGGGPMLCKHAVALALCYLEPPARVQDAGPVFSTRRELDAWCADHSIDHELAVSAELLADAVMARAPHPNVALVLRNLALRDIGSLEGAGRFVGIRALQRPTAEAARQWLERAADDVRVALAEEQHERSAPRDEQPAELWNRLVASRARLRGHAAPRSRATRARGMLDL
ncbi:MAG TPA: SWIM zinc finger family protein, partial [Kofleriaceae bacterium]|nr:SWIM zinc finger family protein [Kofleriaceae bacterium]